MEKMKLVQFLQKYSARPVLGAEEPGASSSPVSELAHRDLEKVQQTNEYYFRMYWALLIVVFLLTFGIAIHLRAEMGGIATVLGAGGVTQGGLIVLLSSEWKNKVRIDTVATLSRRLSPDQLQIVLMELLKQLQK